MRKINARECNINLVSIEDRKNFLNENHNQGNANSYITYGLFFEEELVQLMSFGKPRFNKNYQWEIIRECTKKNCLVRGGTSKLWKHFLKKHNCHSCICYHYPHNKETLYTSHLVDNCQFNCIQNAKPIKKIYFEGEWNGKLKRIDKSILERHGVDRLLNTSQGQDRSNEQILADLGFKKKYEDGYSPQIDIFYPFGVVYRVDDLTDGSFYIGMTEKQYSWERGYKGSGLHWNRHLECYPDIEDNPYDVNAHLYERTILHSCKTPKETRDLELKEIKNHIANPKCKNTQTRTQSMKYFGLECDVYGKKMGKHNRDCIFYNENLTCKECGGVNGNHKHECKYRKTPEPCIECGGKHGKHKAKCSKYHDSRPIFYCKECGSKGSTHKKNCSKYKQPTPCKECGGLFKHKGSCSKASVCDECGGKSGQHKNGCSKKKKCKQCIECGGLSGNHKNNCSYKKKLKSCEECNGLGGHHKKTCSKYSYKSCSECNGKNGHHLKTCSKYKGAAICKECGSMSSSHKKYCSKYAVRKTQE